jgi:hypothetical protein
MQRDEERISCILAVKELNFFNRFFNTFIPLPEILRNKGEGNDLSCF